MPSRQPADLSRHRRDWEELASFNPEWAVLTRPEAKSDGWDVDAFLDSGRRQIAGVLDEAGEMGIPRRRRRALDFGCGAGRLAAALSESFGSYVGVDISEGMIERARELNAGRDNCEFILNETDDLARFSDGEFDGVFTFLVLQHMPSTEVIRSYLRELGRVLAPGGLLAFQMLDRIPLIYRTRVRGRLYRLARAAGVSVDRAHRMGLQAMSVRALPPAEVREVLRAAGCEVVRHHGHPHSRGIVSSAYLATRPG